MVWYFNFPSASNIPSSFCLAGMTALVEVVDATSLPREDTRLLCDDLVSMLRMLPLFFLIIICSYGWGSVAITLKRKMPSECLGWSCTNTTNAMYGNDRMTQHAALTTTPKAVSDGGSDAWSFSTQQL
mmetsp:Transcript_21662/g.36898  ORF Transcript_21662/g.36898 Transcript_21662/m.36898 type:complete len:128 (+) Transcript_21662:284-667(+)